MKFKLLAGILMGFAYVGAASALTITGPNPINNLPSGDPDPTCSGPGTGNDPAFISTYCPAMSGLVEVYKNDAPSTESGALAGAYSSSLTGGNSGGTITWNGPQAVVCSVASPCWLLIKDGNQAPGRYSYNLSTLWNGTDTITLVGFWPNQGGISHWALYGGICRVDCGDDDTDVPEPGSLALLGLGLLGLGFSRRRTAK